MVYSIAMTPDCATIASASHDTVRVRGASILCHVGVDYDYFSLRFFLEMENETHNHCF